MTKVIIEPSRSIYGQCFDKDNENVGRIDLNAFELSLSEEDDGIDLFMHHPDQDKNCTYICTVLSPDEAELLADSLYRLAKMSREVANKTS